MTLSVRWKSYMIDHVIHRTSYFLLECDCTPATTYLDWHQTCNSRIDSFESNINGIQYLEF